MCLLQRVPTAQVIIGQEQGRGMGPHQSKWQTQMAHVSPMGTMSKEGVYT